MHEDMLDRHRGRGGPAVPARRGPADPEPRRDGPADRGRAGPAPAPDPGRARVRTAALAGHQFVDRIATALPPVTADRTYLEQVVRNLVTNAAKYGREGGTVTVTAELECDDAIAVRVIDDGDGVAEGEEERVFDLFYRSAATVAPRERRGHRALCLPRARRGDGRPHLDAPHGPGGGGSSGSRFRARGRRRRRRVCLATFEIRPSTPAPLRGAAIWHEHWRRLQVTARVMSPQVSDRHAHPSQ